MSQKDPAPAILVVDDNADAADSLALILELEGFRTRAVYDGRAALSAIVEDPPTAVLLDIGLPDLDGLEVARQARERLPRAHRLLIVALSGHGRAQDLAAARSAGCDEHLVKPVDPDVVLELLRQRL
ncbi:MAG: response regulator [Limnobacter sp.]|nr:response regulator [Limnobacter sp.]